MLDLLRPEAGSEIVERGNAPAKDVPWIPIEGGPEGDGIVFDVNAAADVAG
jgi:hypothetical protein